MKSPLVGVKVGVGHIIWRATELRVDPRGMCVEQTDRQPWKG